MTLQDQFKAMAAQESHHRLTKRDKPKVHKDAGKRAGKPKNSHLFNPRWGKGT